MTPFKYAKVPKAIRFSVPRLFDGISQETSPNIDSSALSRRMRFAWPPFLYPLFFILYIRCIDMSNTSPFFAITESRVCP